MAKAPKLSVLMPVYNAGAYLAAAIESILGQSFKDFELLLLDDASTDGSAEVIRAFAARNPQVVAVRNPANLKLARTLNRGIELGRGEYIVRMDADDLAAPERLALQTAYMDAHPLVGISGGSMKIMDARGMVTGERRYHLRDHEIRRHLFHYSPFCHPAVIIRKSVLAKAGLYDPEFNPAEDYDLYFRIGQHSQFGNLAETLLFYRVVPRSMTTGATRRMELQTLAIRRKAVRAYGYRMTFGAWLYWLAEYLSVFLVPAGFKMWVFSKLREQRGGR